MCGISHIKPTGRKCTRSAMATDTNALATSTITGGHLLNSASMSSFLGSLTSVAPTAMGSPVTLTTPRPSLGTPTSTTTFLTFSSTSLLMPSGPGPLSLTVPFHLPTGVDPLTHPTIPPSPHPNTSTQRWPVGTALHPASHHFHAGPDIPPDDQHGKQESSVSGLPGWVPTSSNIRVDSRGCHWRASCDSWSLWRSGRRIGARAAAGTGDGMQQWIRGRRGRHHNTTQSVL